MKNNPNLHAFLESLIDYAGLFPPTSLSLDTAIKNYAKYIFSEDSWMLGPFIIPVTKLTEIPTYADLFSQEKPFNLSVVGRKSESEHACIVQLREDLDKIRKYRNEYHYWSNVEAFELPLAPILPTQNLLEEVSTGVKKLGMKAFCEVSLLKEDDWQKHLCSTLDAIAAFNSLQKDRVGVKLRTGGIKAEMFPSPEKVAFIIASCRDRDLPIKFTAGLHHPIRLYREEVNTKMHGFLNLFLAGMLAYHLNLDVQRLEEIISDESANHFTLEDDRLAWQNLSITFQEIKELRKNSLCSFGSCSFDEPRNELLELKNQQEVL
jgi:hypothetical protein